MIIGTLVTASANSWLSIWIGLEINLLSVIPLFINRNLISNEASIKYFITQAMASLVLLTGAVLRLVSREFIIPQINSWANLIINVALLTKLGAAPFHFWFPQVIEGLSWLNSLVLITWQKIAPITIILINYTPINLIYLSIIASLIIRTIGRINQISLRKILAFSSINHIGWILRALIISSSTWIIYFLTYSIILANIVTLMKILKINYLRQAKIIINKNKLIKTTVFLNFLSLGGLPPFIGFLPKWLVINWLVQNKMIIITTIIILTALIILFVYTRVIITSTVLETSQEKLFQLKTPSIFPIITNLFVISSLVIRTPVFSIL